MVAKDYDETPIKVLRFEEANGFYTTEQRSKQMSKIRAKNTKTEVIFRKALWHNGFRFRKNSKYVIGKPDVSSKKLKIAVFVDGEFWHGYDWETRKEKIKSNRGFWVPKIERNMQRDREVNFKLEKAGFTVMRFWEKDIKRDFDGAVTKVMEVVANLKKNLDF